MLAGLDRFVWILLAVLFELFVRLREMQASECYAGASAGSLSRLVTRSNV
jgi:hypothetical protein